MEEKNGIYNKYNIVKLLRDRELKSNAAEYLQRHTQVTESLIKRLGLEFELEGHKGCVNCIEWSKDGRYYIISRLIHYITFMFNILGD